MLNSFASCYWLWRSKVFKLFQSTEIILDCASSSIAIVGDSMVMDNWAISAGKTTLATSIVKKLRDKGEKVCLFDGT